MDADGINQVLREVFGSGGKTINGWVSIRCPLAKYQAEHRHGFDSRESAGVSVNPTGTSIFNCFTCGNKMPLHALLRKYSNFTGEDLDDLIEELEEESYLGPRELPEWERVHETEELVALDSDLYLDLYESAENHPYVASRGISPETARKLRLMVDPRDPADNEERILFPVFGPKGELYGLSGRATSDSARLKVRDYFGLKKAACLLGSHLIDPKKHKYVLAVEGLFDYANCWQCKQPGVAVMHSTMTEKQAAILRDIGLPVYMFYDDDLAGTKGVNSAGIALERYLPVMKVRYPKVWIKSKKDKYGGHWLKDPGELTSEEFSSMIADARLF